MKKWEEREREREREREHQERRRKRARREECEICHVKRDGKMEMEYGT